MPSRASVLFCWLPTFLTATAAILAFVAGDNITQNGASVPLLIFASLITLSAVSVFIAHFRNDVNDIFAWGTIILNGALVIVFFAGLHAGAGVICTAAVCPNSLTIQMSGEAVNVSTSFTNALYFSVVTFTTLGYGDFQPLPDLRLLAGLQALVGYMYLGLTVGSLIDLGGRRR